MKRSLLAITAALLALTACNTHTVTVRYDILTVDIDFPYSEGSQNKLTLNAEVQFPNEGFSEEGLPRACEAIRVACFGEEYKHFSGSLEELGENWRDKWHEDYMSTNAEMLKEMKMSETDAPFLNWGVEIKGSFGEFYHDSHINYKVESYQYLGGAHGTTAETPMVLDLSTGEAVHYNIFTGNTSHAQLCSLLDKHKFDEMDIPKDVDKSQVFSATTIEPSQHFSVDDEEGISFYYQPADIAPSVFGVIEIKIPWDELQ
jgi:hypothetical protein